MCVVLLAGLAALEPRDCYHQHIYRHGSWQDVRSCTAIFLSKSDTVSNLNLHNLFGALKDNDHLHTLVLNGLVDDLAALALADAVQNSTALRNLDLNGNAVGNEGAQALAGVAANGALETLSLHDNAIGAEGARHVAHALRASASRVHTLDLGSNGMVGDTGAGHLARALPHAPALLTLVLAANGIGDSGASALASALQSNDGLETLDLASNLIGPRGGAELAEALEYNHALTHIGTRDRRPCARLALPCRPALPPAGKSPTAGKGRAACAQLERDLRLAGLSSNAGIAREDHRRMLHWIGRGAGHRRRTAEERRRGRSREL